MNKCKSSQKITQSREQQSLLTDLYAQLQQQKQLNLQRLHQIEQVQQNISQLQIYQCAQIDSPFENDLIDSRIVHLSLTQKPKHRQSQHLIRHASILIEDDSNLIQQVSQTLIPSKESSLRTQLQSHCQMSIIKAFRKKSTVLQSLAVLKKQSSLFESHKRVILKQFIQEMRSLNRLVQVQNDSLLEQSEGVSTLANKLQIIHEVLKNFTKSKLQI